MSEYVIPGIEIFRGDVAEAEAARRGCLMVPTNTARHILNALSAPAAQGIGREAIALVIARHRLEMDEIRAAAAGGCDVYPIENVCGHDRELADRILALLPTEPSAQGEG